MPDTSSRMSVSSSTIRISDAILPLAYRFQTGRLHRLFRRYLRRKPQPYPGTALTGHLNRGVRQFDASTMVLQNPANNGETKSGALLARGDVRLQQARTIFLRQ